MGNLVGVVLALDGLAFNLKLLQLTCNLVKLLRHRVALHAELCRSLIHKVDGLVGKETVGDVTLGELYGGNAGIVLNTHLVVVLITFLQATKYRDGRKLVRLVDHNSLETTLKSLVLLEVFLILVECGCAYAAKLATCKCRLKDVGSVHGSLATACTHKSVNLVDEEDDATVGIGNFLDDAFESLLKLALVLGTSHKRTHIQ